MWHILGGLTPTVWPTCYFLSAWRFCFPITCLPECLWRHCHFHCLRYHQMVSGFAKKCWPCAFSKEPLSIKFKQETNWNPKDLSRCLSQRFNAHENKLWKTKRLKKWWLGDYFPLGMAYCSGANKKSFKDGNMFKPCSNQHLQNQLAMCKKGGWKKRQQLPFMFMYKQSKPSVCLTKKSPKSMAATGKKDTDMLHPLPIHTLISVPCILGTSDNTGGFGWLQFFQKVTTRNLINFAYEFAGFLGWNMTKTNPTQGTCLLF